MVCSLMPLTPSAVIFLSVPPEKAKISVTLALPFITLSTNRALPLPSSSLPVRIWDMASTPADSRALLIFTSPPGSTV